MKTKLEQLTLAEFVDLACGRVEVLLEGAEIHGRRELAIVMRDIVMEYRAIADPTGSATYLKRIDGLIKAHMSFLIFTMCQNLVVLGRFDKVKEVLAAFGLTTDGWNDKRVKTEVYVRLQKSKRHKDEYDEEKESDMIQDASEVRNSFNAMIAGMMAHFKFQIDPATMSAAVFAHLVARHNGEIKTMKSAMRRR